MSRLQMPRKGQSAAMMAELQAEHAAQGAPGQQEVTNVTPLQPANVETRVTANEPSNVLTPDPTVVTANERTTEVTTVRANEPAPVASLEPYIKEPAPEPPTGPVRKRPSAPAPNETRGDRLAFALDRAATDAITVVTVRIPAGLNRYVDDYVARINRVNPQGRYRKQDAVAEAFAAFYADHVMPPPPPDENL